MKSIYLRSFKCFVGAYLVWASFCGCMDDFLEQPPISDITPENYLLTEDHLSAYTIARYPFADDGCDIYLADWGTDNQAKRSYKNCWFPGEWKVGQTGGSWNFESIYPLNYFLNIVVPRYEQKVLTGNETNIRHYIGEGYFLRAYEYFQKLKVLGDFPIIKETLPDNKEILSEASKRSPRNQVARFILEDLDRAIELMNNSPVGGRNRLTQDVAYLFKSRVALFEATWLKYHKGTALVPNGPGWPGKEKDYNANFEYSSGNIDGEIDFFLDQAMEASKVVAEKHGLTENSKVIKESTGDPSNPYYEMYNSTNLNAYDEVLLWREFSNALAIRHTYNGAAYLQGPEGYTRQFVDNFLLDNGLPIYADNSGYYKGDDYIENVKINRDWRLRLFMKAPGEVKAFINIPTPQIEQLPPICAGSTTGAQTSETGYDVKKGLYYDKEMSNGYGMDITALPIFRAAEAYLIYIEACYEKNGAIDELADKYWKAIRVRAGVDPDYQKTIAATDMQKEALNDFGAYSHNELIDPTLYNIRRERRCELMAEGFRFSDLKRWRALDQVKNFHPEGIKLWGPMGDLPFEGSDPTKKLYKDYFSYGFEDETKNSVSSPDLSEYLRVHQININKTNLAYNGYNWCEAHYLDPIAVGHFLDSAEDSKTVEKSPIYQNPGWPIEAGAAPLGY